MMVKAESSKSTYYSQLNNKAAFLGVFLLAVIVRLLFVKLFRLEPINDLWWNDSVGWNLVSGRGFTASLESPYVPGVFRTPGYPIFLAVVYFFFDHSYVAVYICQAFLDSITAVLIILIARKLLSLRVAMISGMIYATYPYAAYFCGYLHQDILLTFTIVLTIWGTVRATNSPRQTIKWFMVGLSVGMATMVKPLFIVYGLMPVLVLFLFVKEWQEQCKFLVVLSIGAATLILPWGIRNYLVFHSFPPLAVGGTGTNLTYLLTELDGGEANLVNSLKISMSQSSGLSKEKYLQEFIDGEMLIERERMLARNAWPQLMAHWPQYIWLMVRHIPRLWISFYAIGRNPLIAKLGQLTSILYLLLGLIGMYLLRFQWRKLLPIYLTMVLVTLMYAPYTAEARYTLPARPMLIIFVAIMINLIFTSLWSKFYKRSFEEKISPPLLLIQDTDKKL